MEIEKIKNELENSVKNYCIKNKIPDSALVKLGHSGFVMNILSSKIDELEITPDLLEHVKNIVIDIHYRFVNTDEFEK
ncbi:hypothetical protein [Cytophaga aurantiaca]|uniref:hypothetical protein n=1 Tax=Cytophaga aurantiaca TaxID=29530 RepID=UPI00035D8AB4|nr:hypothetical protein [Cytophaga aurantiaca]